MKVFGMRNAQLEYSYPALSMKLSMSIYDLVLIYVCHFHHHHPLTFPQILLISSYKPSYSSWTIEILVLTSWIPASKNFFPLQYSQKFFLKF